MSTPSASMCLAISKAFWFDDKSGKFITSTFYMDKLPEWVNKFNKQKLPNKYLSKKWETLYPIDSYKESTSDDNNYENGIAEGEKAVLPLDLPTLYKKHGYKILRNTPFGCNLTFDIAKAELCGNTRLGLIKYVMALMNGARLGIAAQSVGVEQEAYNEGLAYAKERAQFGEKIINFPAVYDMLSRMKAKLDAGRSLLYCCARYVDIYKALEDIARDTKLTPEERQEMKKYTRLADAFTPLAKGMNSEYANQNAYDAISIHGGSGFIMEYKCQRLFRDARIFSIYEGTTQLQVVAAIRYITNGTYLSIIKEMLENEVSDDLKPLKERVAKLVELYEAAINKVKEANDQAVHDFLARRLYNMTGDIVMSLLILDDATKAPEMFQKSANVYVRMAEEEVLGHSAYIQNFKAEDLESFKA